MTQQPLDHARVPYADALARHADRDPLMFMVPGHAATPDGLTQDLADFVGERAVRLDIPQLVDGIDVGSQSPLAESVALAADAWSARRSWFLANGSSQGNRMAVIGVANGRPNDVIVAQRSAHSSLLDGLVVTGLKPTWVLPELDRQHGIHHGVTPEALDEALHRAAAVAAPAGGAVAAAYVVSPSYFGVVSDISALAAVAHAHGVPLIVDAAWGAHFGFHPELPAFPTVLGADIVVTSAHKMGGSLGQSALIHLANGPFADRLEPALDRAYHLTQTTSASSLLFASIDVARRSLVRGTSHIEATLEAADRLRELVRSHPTLTLVSDGFADYAGDASHGRAGDPLRVSIGVARTGLTGYEMRAGLARTHSILLEIATTSAVVAFLGPGKDLDVERLMRAMNEVIDRVAGPDSTAKSVPGYPSVAAHVPPIPAPGPGRMTPREAYFAQAETVDADAAIGRISVDALSAYPPGVPNIMPGEEITREAIDFLRAVVASPIGYVRGAMDSEVAQLRVVRD